jgi:spore germination protein GerM
MNPPRGLYSLVRKGTELTDPVKVEEGKTVRTAREAAVEKEATAELSIKL